MDRGAVFPKHVTKRFLKAFQVLEYLQQHLNANNLNKKLGT